uniref:Uncharacterized protein n=1 Tax=Pan troglodytes TaxID=9598 RepID=A0A2I3TP40_PANTR
MRDNTSPISVILVSSGSRGNKLLFRYPFQRSQEHPASQTSPGTGRHKPQPQPDSQPTQTIRACFLLHGSLRHVS